MSKVSSSTRRYVNGGFRVDLIAEFSDKNFLLECIHAQLGELEKKCLLKKDTVIKSTVTVIKD